MNNTEATEIVARYNTEETAANSAILRTAATGRTHRIQPDPTTDTFLVVTDRDDEE